MNSLYRTGLSETEYRMHDVFQSSGEVAYLQLTTNKYWLKKIVGANKYRRPPTAFSGLVLRHGPRSRMI
jgi:hypothetical protein